MRPEGKNQLDSLYFDYPLFESPARRAAAGETEITSVAIVGAGPVGLMAALTLASFGIASVVFEKKNTFNDGSRAICLARHSYHLFEKVGALEPFLRKSLGWTKGRSYFRGKKILEFEMAHDRDQKFMPMYNLQQQYIEQFLWQAASKSALIDIRWLSEATSIGSDTDGVSIQVEDPSGVYQVRADWLLAADGARSSVRAIRGLKLKGENYEGRYVIADVKADLPVDPVHPTVRRALFDPVCLPGKTVLIHRQPDNIWRIDYQIDDAVTIEHATKEEIVRANVAGVLKEIGYAGNWELEWWSSYTANTLLLDDYRDGRIFFIGDSAHIVPIFGVRGLNNGLIDAFNIGWKIAMVASGAAGGGCWIVIRRNDGGHA
ncbi:MAG: FAD-dependent monooxygenase [Parvularculaceae bacterium]